MFGTYIFKINSSLCRTSDPLEYNTIDYIPPVIALPNIDLDSNDDDQYPCYDDSRIVTVDLFDEGGIKEAKIMYSIDNGTNWNSVVLVEQAANPGTWEGAIPAQEENTTVSWYVIAWDNSDLNTTRKDYNTGEPFTYMVKVKFVDIPEKDVPAIPGFSLITIIPITVVAVIAITIIYSKKRSKYKK